MLHFTFLAGDITQKGYEKKRAKLLGPYLSRGECLLYKHSGRVAKVSRTVTTPLQLVSAGLPLNFALARPLIGGLYRTVLPPGALHTVQ